MFTRLLVQSVVRQRRRKLLALTAVALGMTVVTAMSAISLDIGDKMGLELRAYGANLVVTPLEDSLDVQLGGVDLNPAGRTAYLNESSLPQIKKNFWKHNILGFAPILTTQVQTGPAKLPVTLLGTYFEKQVRVDDNETFVTGVKNTNPWWKVEGNWPKDDSLEVLVGEKLARQLDLKLPDTIDLNGTSHPVTGILSTGGDEDSQIVAPLALVQKLSGKPGAVRRVMVSALTKPEDDFARRDPRTMGPSVLERWSCSPYAASIAYIIGQSLPGTKVEQVRRVAQNEGTLLTKISGLMLLITLAAVFASALSVAAATTTALYERRHEMGLMRTLGAGRINIASLLASEMTILALIGGGVGYTFGVLLASQIGRAIFSADISAPFVLLPSVLLMAVLVTLLGASFSIRRALRIAPAGVLRGDPA